jgi:hypothetical protein
MSLKSLQLFFILIIFFLGCSTDSDEVPIDFGADYNIVVSDDLPDISGDELVVEVLYSGCEPNHDFAINFQSLRENENEMWLTKITPNQECEETFQEIRRFPLPEELQSGRLIFTGPNVNLVLREN